jgi:hypothetical protein
MRLILIDSEDELIRCNLAFQASEQLDTQVERLSKTAAFVLDGKPDPDGYVLGSFTPYQSERGYFVFLVEDGGEPASPTTLNEVMSACEYVGYVRRNVISGKLAQESR